MNSTLPAKRKTYLSRKTSKAFRDSSVIKEEVTKSQTKAPLSQSYLLRIIYNKAIYATSEAIATVLARPNALLCGAICCFIFTLATYLLAKNLGYTLSGFESIASFATGWILGLSYDILAGFVRKLVRK